MNVFKQGLPDDDWDTRQRSRSGHMLQGRPWAQFQQALGRQVVWAEGDGWSWLGVVTAGRGVTYLYAPYGPTAETNKAFAAALECLEAAASELNLDFVRCEPIGVDRAAVVQAGMNQAKMVQPQHTLIVDLRKDESDLRHDLSSGHRNAINGSERRGLALFMSRSLQDVEGFLELLHQTSGSRGFRAHDDRYYRVMLETLMPLKAASLGLAKCNGELVAAAIFFDYGDTRAYAHAGANQEARKLQAAAPLVWQAILDGKTEGLARFDLWGIAPEGAPESHPWAGFTRFKRSFGGSEITYTGTWEMPIKKSKYRIYRIAKKALG